MKRSEVVDRARSALNHGAIYKLGAGGKNPLKTVPWDEDMASDCTGLTCWARGLHRMFWLDTAMEYRLATGQPAFLYRVPWAQAKIGDTVTCGDWTDSANQQREGHTGVISEVDENGPTKVIHCSLGNWKKFSDAIQEGGPSLWIQHGIVVRYGGLED